jgi:polysaccharide chain length determinant protein (PEP-CTERM system associated)
VSYTGRDPRTVKNVTERLASLFIDQSLHDRALLAEGTDQFLEAQLDEAKRRLVDQEKKLEAYRTKYSGQLPSQVDANLQAVHNTMQTIQTTAESISADRARRLLLEKSLKELENEAPSDTASASHSAASGSPDAASSGTTAQQLEAAQQTLAVMRQHMLDTHPDVKRQKRFVDGLQKKLDAELLEHPVSTDPIVAMPPAEQARQRRMQTLKDDIDALDKQIEAKDAEQKRLQKVAASYQAHVEAVPARESEMTELTRDYSTLSAFYTSLRQKKEESKIAANLERRQAGEQFSLLDPARMPEKPSSPNRPQINGFGMAAGLGLGIGLIVLLEYRDTSFKTDDEVTALLSLPVLAVVPVMQSDEDRQRARKRRVAIGVGLGSTVAACLTVLVYTFVR